MSSTDLVEPIEKRVTTDDLDEGSGDELRVE
jgi:hypothetical protein